MTHSALPQHHPEWQLLDDGRRIERVFETKNYMSALEFVQIVGNVAVNSAHFPDIHLEGSGRQDHLKNVRVVSWTPKLKGLSYEDFMLALKLDAVEEQRQKGLDEAR